MSLGLWASLAFGWVSEPLWRFVLSRRVGRGKEDPQRVQEKFARYGPDRFREPGRLIWMHALSVGESLALLPLIEHARAAEPDLHILLTTSTRTSADALLRVGLPEGCTHRYAPVDTHASMRRFLAFWRPDVAVVTELDLWPVRLWSTRARGVPLVLINARISGKNFTKRSRSPGLYRAMLGMFERVLVQDEITAERMKVFAVEAEKIEVSGALKAAARSLPADEVELEKNRVATRGRTVWLAAATEPREEADILAAHLRFSAQNPGALLILAPRDPDRGAACLARARADFPHVSQRSAGQEISRNTEVYVADTIGEMGLWYRLAPISFIGHSLPVEGAVLRGKNPFEAVALGSVVLHGPQVVDFAETYLELDAAKAARGVENGAELCAALAMSLAERQAMAERATAYTKARRQVLYASWAAIAAVLPRA